MIEMGIGKAFTSLFKERRWWVKFGIIFSISYLAIALSLITGVMDLGKNANSIKSYTTLELTTTLLIGLVALIVSIILVVFSLWYNYENTQAAIQNRQTKLIWEYSFSDSVKKTAKYGVASIVYGLISFVISMVVIGIPVFATIILMGFIYDSATVSKEYGVIIGLGFILLCCIFTVVVLGLMAFVYALTTPGYLRLVASNTFSEAFHFRSNLRIGKKYFGYFIAAILILLVFSFVLGFATSIFSAVSTAVSLTNPVFGLILQLIIQIPATIVTTYLSYFVFPKILGNIYRGIISKEDELKFLRK